MAGSRTGSDAGACSWPASSLFTVSSLLDGLAWSSGSLIAFRALQGLGAALLSPAALSILTTTFREGRERNLALGIWGAVSGSGGAAGVLLGGALTSALSWSWIFFINVPVGVLSPRSARGCCGRAAPSCGTATSTSPARVSITSGLMLLVYAMTRATQHGWGTVATIALLAASAALIGAFFVIEHRSTAPLLPLRIFRLRTLSASNVSGLMLGGAVFSQFFLLTLYMQQVLALLRDQDRRRLHPAHALDHLLLGRRTGAGHAARRAARAAGRARAVDGALVLFAQLPVDGEYFWDLFPAFLLSGIGLALAFVPMSIGALTGVRQADAGVASGLINTSQQIGGAIGVAIATTIATTFTTSTTSKCTRARARSAAPR